MVGAFFWGVLLVAYFTFDNAIGQPLPYILTGPYQAVLEEREVQVYTSLKSYKSSLLQRLELIDEYLKDYEDCKKGNYSAQENPIQATRMIRRFPKYVAPIKKLVRDGKLEKELFTNLHNFSSNVGYRFPGKYDYYETLEAFLSLQYTYNLNPIEIIDGIINGIKTGVGFTADQSLEMAVFALQRKFFTLSYEWLAATQEKYETNKTLIEDLEQSLFKEHDQVFETEISVHERYIFTSRISNISKKDFPMTLKENMLEKWGRDREWVMNWGNETVQAQHYSYLHLCNGKESQTANETKDLKCWVSLEALYILPIKVEQISIQPELLVYHDIVPDKWIEIMKEKAFPKIVETNSKRTIDKMFVNLDFTWFSDDDIDNLKIPILTKMESIRKIKVQRMIDNEHFKIGFYGKGGYYRIHHDAIPGYKQGDVRIDFGKDSWATFLFYFTNVKLGGATVFPNLGISMFPEKGSAFYWPNFDDNGDPDIRMVHGTCPVLLGQKWIANEFVGLMGNSQGRNCSRAAIVTKIHSVAWHTGY